MITKLFSDQNFKDKSLKVISILIIITVFLLSFDVFTDNKDGRKQIVDDDGGTEAELCYILSDINGVGDVDVMLQYDSESNITGAIVTAQGAEDPIVKNNVVNAVMALFGISASSVEVFEKTNDYKEESDDE